MRTEKDVRHNYDANNRSHEFIVRSHTIRGYFTDLFTLTALSSLEILDEFIKRFI